MDTLSNKLSELDVVLIKQNPDIIGLTEMLNKNRDLDLDDTFFNTPGYDQFHNVRRASKRGVIIYIKCYLKARKRMTLILLLKLNKLHILLHIST